MQVIYVYLKLYDKETKVEEPDDYYFCVFMVLICHLGLFSLLSNSI